MFKNKKAEAPDCFDTLLGAKTVFEGNIESEGTVRVDGRIKGDLKVNGDVYIGTDAVITGSVYANNINLSGTVEGNIQARGLLRILSTARLFGDIQVHSFVADEGGVFQGKCSMLDTNSTIEKVPEKTHSKKSHSGKDFKKSSVLDQIYDEKEKNNSLIGNE
ncbi:MAG: polymer-forming cytoskeletal protein [Clostridia bacterium]|nr:polymer-forming cytoskeletal protein [Clostridia bacterium]